MEIPACTPPSSLQVVAQHEQHAGHLQSLPEGSIQAFREGVVLRVSRSGRMVMHVSCQESPLKKEESLPFTRKRSRGRSSGKSMSDKGDASRSTEKKQRNSKSGPGPRDMQTSQEVHVDDKRGTEAQVPQGRPSGTGIKASNAQPEQRSSQEQQQVGDGGHEASELHKQSQVGRKSGGGQQLSEQPFEQQQHASEEEQQKSCCVQEFSEQGKQSKSGKKSSGANLQQQRRQQQEQQQQQQQQGGNHDAQVPVQAAAPPETGQGKQRHQQQHQPLPQQSGPGQAWQTGAPLAEQAGHPCHASAALETTPRDKADVEAGRQPTFSGTVGASNTNTGPKLNILVAGPASTSTMGSKPWLHRRGLGPFAALNTGGPGVGGEAARRQYRTPLLQNRPLPRQMTEAKMQGRKRKHDEDSGSDSGQEGKQACRGRSSGVAMSGDEAEPTSGKGPGRESGGTSGGAARNSGAAMFALSRAQPGLFRVAGLRRTAISGFKPVSRQ